jgi:hypothetical protein
MLFCSSAVMNSIVHRAAGLTLCTGPTELEAVPVQSKILPKEVLSLLCFCMKAYFKARNCKDTG